MDAGDGRRTEPMKYELFIALRYLFSRQTAAEPSLIALITTAGIALAVATLIGVLAVVGGFEGDLRTKMLSTRAHILITGASHGEVEDPEAVQQVVEQMPHVEALSPFIESELMISSPTKYSIVVYRGVNPDLIRSVSSLEGDMLEGKIEWLSNSSEALQARLRARFGDDDGNVVPAGEDDPTMGDLHRLQQDIDNMKAQIEILRAEDGGSVDGQSGAADVVLGADAAEQVDDGSGAEDEVDDASSLMPALPAPRGTPLESETDDEALRNDGILMPSLPRPAGDGQEPLTGTRSARTLERSQNSRNLPGIIIGRGVQMSLRVLVGDTVNVINPDGDLGPQGPIPKSRPHRVVGVFYSGLLEYDETVGIVDMSTARELLGIPGQSVTGIEVRLDDLHIADEVAASLDQALADAGMPEVEVRSWKEMNRSLFSALALEKAAIAFGIGTIFIVSFLLILLVLWMFVADKAREIAVLKSIGASRASVAKIFVMQGALMGLFGALAGLTIGMSFVLYAVHVGIPLPADVYYIDRVPIEVQASEVMLVLFIAVVTSVAGAALPALQAAALDPVEGLRRE